MATSATWKTHRHTQGSRVALRRPVRGSDGGPYLLQDGVGPVPQRVVGQEEQQSRTFGQLLFQEVRLGSWGLQPLQDALMVLKHPAADGGRGEVTLPPRENLTSENRNIRETSFPVSLTCGPTLTREEFNRLWRYTVSSSRTEMTSATRLLVTTPKRTTPRKSAPAEETKRHFSGT